MTKAMKTGQKSKNEAREWELMHKGANFSLRGLSWWHDEYKKETKVDEGYKEIVKGSGKGYVRAYMEDERWQGGNLIATRNVPSHKKWRRDVQKNVMEEEKEEGGTSGGLDSSYKSRAPLPFFNLLWAKEQWTQGTKRAQSIRWRLRLICDFWERHEWR